MNSPRLILCELGDPGIPRLESYSPFCLKAHRALALSGLAYERRHGDRPSAFRHLNPSAQVPVLLVGGEPVYDSTAIVSRIDTLSGGALTRGLDRRTRAEAFLWEEMADSVLSGFVVATRWLDDANWPKTSAAYFAGMPSLVRAFVPDRLRRRVRERLVARDVISPNLDACWARFEETLDELEARAPLRGFWLGASPSRADIAIFAQLWSLKTELSPWQANRVEARDRLSGWLRRVDDACLRGTTRIVVDAPPERFRRVAGAFA